MNTPLPRRRGRPPKIPREYSDTRELLLRAGVEALTEQGLSGTGLDGLLKRVNVPKGSFYHYFESKDAFGRELIQRYTQYFADRLDHWLLDETLPPLKRLEAFVDWAKEGMVRYQFQRGCLVGNLGQEIGLLPDDYRTPLEMALQDWQQRLALCLEKAKSTGDLSPQADSARLAECFWIGWEGAVMRARMTQSTQPMSHFFEFFLHSLPH